MPPHPRSAWRATSVAQRTFPNLDGDRDTDTLIIGAGFTGLSTARDLLAKGAECLVVDGKDVAFGASGRSGGFAVPRYKANYSTLAKTFGNAMAVHLFREVVGATDAIAQTVETFKIDCSYQRNGHVTPAHSPGALEGIEADVAFLKAHAEDDGAHILDRKATAEALGTEVYFGAYVDGRGGCLHPYDYTRGLASGLADRGVPISVGTSVTRLQRDGDRWIAETNKGRIRARCIVIATNGYSLPLRGAGTLHRRIVPVSSSVVATRPLDLNESRKTLPSLLPVTDTRRLVNYFRMLPNGQLVFGGRGDITGRRDDPDAYKMIEGHLATTFPHLAGIDIQERWSGFVAVTLDGFPHAGALDDNLFYAIGYGGRGVALTSLMGSRLAKMALGEPIPSDPMGDQGFTPVPFHAFRRTGMRIMAKYYQFRDRIER
ncbi:FAD-binding oxidoreductase [Acuticoccus sp. M5D2P5]|uniref:NAD(P)/FAD-dependent oxidoreductase n=1 Tax=Acuticoccus kalidii TaxID=2910977 RepID=UPI001F29B28D|nr:FAD-binding oxidoreductase [Acuticoccus kalidii]MCF3933261.1 FAD-binding oxidoreductase [Acuticoccus kalidii]